MMNKRRAGLKENGRIGDNGRPPRGPFRLPFATLRDRCYAKPVVHMQDAAPTVFNIGARPLKYGCDIIGPEGKLALCYCITPRLAGPPIP